MAHDQEFGGRWKTSFLRNVFHYAILFGAGAAATITGAATSAASLGIVSGGSGAAGAAFYSSKMAKRSADVTEFGFVRLSQWDAFRAPQDTHGRSNSMPQQQLEHDSSIPEDRIPHVAANEPPASTQLPTPDARCERSGGGSPGVAQSPTQVPPQGNLEASGTFSTMAASPVAVRREGSIGTPPAKPAAPSGAAPRGNGVSPSRMAPAGQSPGSSRSRSWKQWGKEKLWRSGSSSSVDALAHPGVVPLTYSRCFSDSCLIRILLLNFTTKTSGKGANPPTGQSAIELDTPTIVLLLSSCPVKRALGAAILFYELPGVQ